MVLNTLTVGAAVTPGVIETAFSHYIKRAPLRGKPTAHISYDEGLHLVRQFLDYASNHTVDEVQAFTAQWVPCPRWVKATDISIAETHLTHAAKLLSAQLGPSGLAAVGGSQWWQWRPSRAPLKAEWIEMRADYNLRKSKSLPSSRNILYIHGGAYYFGSIDEHRYQLQRHARKLKARLLAPRYRLAPQFPFPCGLQDALAAYLHLLTECDPSSILLMGDSAGAGMVLSVLCTLRDQGVPLPAGAILISPWVDLTHSFPSVSGEGTLDYIPAHGFHHRPSVAWPPPNEDELRDLRTRGESTKTKAEAKTKENDAVKGVKVQSENPAIPENPDPARNPPALSINMDGKHITLIDQIQLYAANSLLSHPLVSPALQPTLGGLPPLLIQVGGGELLRDEQVYIAHKAANPSMYPTSDTILDIHDPERKMAGKYPPTKVQLQVWEDLCHVPHTLSFTRPAKHMYRAVAQFGNWVFAQSKPSTDAPLTAPLGRQKEGDAISVISTSSSSSDDTLTSKKTRPRAGSKSSTLSAKGRSLSDGDVPDPATRAAEATSTANASGGDWASTTAALTSLVPDDTPRSSLPSVSATAHLPPFTDSMIRQLVDRHGTIFPLLEPALIPCLNLPAASIGQIKPGPVRKWLAKKAQWDAKFASSKRQVQTKRLQELRRGFATFAGADGMVEETPPPTALAGRQFKLDGKSGAGDGLHNLEAGAGAGKKKSWGLAMWSGWGSKHDTVTVQNSERRSSGAAEGQGGGVDGAGDERSARAAAAADHQDGEEERAGKKERSRSVGAGVRHPLIRALSRKSTKAKHDEKKTRSVAPDDDVPPVPPLPAAQDTRGTDTTAPVANGAADPAQHARSSTVAASTAAAAVVAATAGTAVKTSEKPSAVEAEQTKAEEELMAAALPKGDKVQGSENTFLAPGSARPHNGVVAYPFKLGGVSGHERSASMMTLDSVKGGVAEDLNGDGGGVGGSEDRGAETVERVRDDEDTGVRAKGAQRPKLESFVTANEF